MSKPIRKGLKVEVAQKPSEKIKEPKEIKKEVPKKLLPIWNFPLQGRSVRAKTLKEAQEKLAKEK